MNDHSKSLADLGVENWDRQQINSDDLLLIKWESEGRDFEFMCVEWVCGPATDRDGKQRAPEEYEVVFHGQAHFDGVRHLWFGHEKTENEGYLYYPDLDFIMRAFAMLKEHEDKLPGNPSTKAVHKG